MHKMSLKSDLWLVLSLLRRHSYFWNFLTIFLSLPLSLQMFQDRERLLQEAEFQLRSLRGVHEVSCWTHTQALLHGAPYALTATPPLPLNHLTTTGTSE